MPGELEFYKEHTAHGRHIELQRSAIAGIAFTLCGALIGKLLEHLPLTRDQLPYTTTLFAVGLISWLLSAKLYERFKLHTTVARFARDAYDPNLATLRRQAEVEHKKKFPRLFEVRLHTIWNALFAIVAAIGLATTVLILIR
jgi:hypothetical protein